MQTLVLDTSYQPHRVIDWRRAVGMIFGGKAEVVEEYEEDIRSLRLTIKMPAVVRLLRRVARRRTIRFSRVNVAARDRFLCQYCGERLPLGRLTFDHVIPRSQGGRTSWENIVMACRPCNGQKADRTPVQAGMRLLKEPVRPSWLPLPPSRAEAPSRTEGEGSLPEAWRSWSWGLLGFG